jgi:hypothetical protein
MGLRKFNILTFSSMNMTMHGTYHQTQVSDSLGVNYDYIEDCPC